MRFALSIFSAHGSIRQTVIGRKEVCLTQPEVVFELDNLLNIKSTLKVSPNQTLGKINHKNENGVRVSCVEVKGTNWTERKLCFDESKGLLISVEFPTPSQMNPPEVSRIEFSEFANWEDKIVPHRIRALNGKKEVAGVTVVGLSKMANVNSAAFDPPKDSELWGACAEDVQPATLINRVQPQYPESARRNRTSGTVKFYAAIEADGTVSHLAIIHPAAPELESAAGQAMSQWRYKPVTCAGTPGRVETMIEVGFWLQL